MSEEAPTADSIGRRATTRDVARAAGVSAATVSRVINGEVQVSAATRQRVLAAIDTLHYQPVRSPAPAARNRARWIAFAYRNKSVSSFIQALQTGAIDRCMADNVMLSSHAFQFTGNELREELEGVVRQLQPVGVVLTPPLSVQPGAREVLRALGTPFVRLCPQEDDDLAPRVWFDERAAMRAVVSHVLGMGHKRVAMIAGLPLETPDARREGYLDAIRQARLHSAEREVYCGRYDFTEALIAARRLLQRRNRPTALVCSSDEMAAASLHAAIELGISVPEDLSLTGFDDSSIAPLVVPALTTIHAPLVEMGAAAVDLLIKGAADMNAGMVIGRPWRLVLRQSTAAAPAG